MTMISRECCWVVELNVCQDLRLPNIAFTQISLVYVSLRGTPTGKTKSVSLANMIVDRAISLQISICSEFVGRKIRSKKDNSHVTKKWNVSEDLKPVQSGSDSCLCYFPHRGSSIQSSTWGRRTKTQPHSIVTSNKLVGQD